VVVVLAVVCTGATVWLVLRTPGDGVLMQSPGGWPWSTGRRVVVSGEFNPTGLRLGDEVLAVDGRDIHAWAGDLVRRPVAARPWQPGQTVAYQVRRDGVVREIGVPVRRALGSLRGAPWGDIAAKVLVLLFAGFVFLRRPGVPAARAIVVVAAGFTTQLSIPAFTLQVHRLLGPIGAIPYVLYVTGVLLWPAALLHFALVFPEPRPVARRRWPVVLIYGLPLGMLGVYSALTVGGAATTGVRAVLWLALSRHAERYVYPLAIVLAFWWSYRTTHDPLARQRLRWVAATFAGVMVLTLGLVQLPYVLLHRMLLPVPLQPLLVLPCLVAGTLAILRYRAFDIEVVVNRTLVWGGLTACVAAVYGATLLLLGLVLERQSQPRFVLTLLATGLVALGLQPGRQRLQRLVNHWMYGDRDDPAAVLARLGRQLQAAGPPGEVLEGIVATVAQAMRLPYVAIELDRPGGRAVAARWGQPAGAPAALPLVHDREPVGRLLVGADAKSGPLRPRDRRLLEVLAQQASAAVAAARLAADLEDSRAQLEHAHGRLLHAREEERRRLRRDLHDGIGPLLAGMTLQVDAARNLLGREPAGSDALLGRVRHELQQAVADVRRLVDALQPTPLDQLGLVAALREAAARFSTAALGRTGDDGLLALVEAPDELPRLPAAVELAAYRIATEALTNTAKHADARHCWIRLAGNGALELEVVDDGHGHLGQPPPGGMGLGSMAERATELGGACTVEFIPGVGTRVHARLPLPQG
jgi:signal transduction histidine kinase